jgi:tmRNA-binding protein
MNWGSPEFVIFIVGISTAGWVINNWIRARHGYALEDEWGGKTDRGGAEVKRLKQENAELKERLAQFEDRMIVLERIATDKTVGLAAQIENLRDREKAQ